MLGTSSHLICWTTAARRGDCFRAASAVARAARVRFVAACGMLGAPAALPAPMAVVLVVDFALLSKALDVPLHDWPPTPGVSSRRRSRWPPSTPSTANATCGRSRDGADAESFASAARTLKLHGCRAAGKPVGAPDIDAVREFASVLATAQSADGSIGTR